MNRFKVSLCLVTLFAILIALGACTSDTDYDPTITLPTLPPRHEIDDRTVITIAWWGSPVRHERTLAVLQMFEEQNPTIRFEAEYFSFDAYLTELAARAASGDLWDVFQLGGNYPTYLEHILYLDDLIERGIIDVSNASDDTLYLTTSSGNLIGISNGINAWGIAYDVAVFDQLNLARPHPQWSWEDFVYAALTIREELGIWGVGNFPQESVSLTQYLSQKHMPLFHPTDITRLNIEGPEPIVTFLQMMADLVQADAKPNPRARLDIRNIEDDPLIFRESGMTYIASNQFISLAYAALAIDSERELAMILLPGHISGGATAITSSQMFSISNSSQNPEYAAQFISFFANDIDANMILLGERGVPIMSHVREALENHDDPVVAAVNAFISDITELREAQEQAAFGTLAPINPASSRVDNYMNLITERVVLGIMTPEEGAQAIFDFALEAVAQN